jgi:hypothetical protein
MNVTLTLQRRKVRVSRLNWLAQGHIQSINDSDNLKAIASKALEDVLLQNTNARASQP